jgi:putative transposase
MRQLNGVFTQPFNRTHHTVGHLLKGRFKAIMVEKDPYLLEVSRYMALNPLRAKAVTSPGETRHKRDIISSNTLLSIALDDS